MRIEYPSRELYQFAAQILQRPNNNFFNARFFPNEQVIEVDQSVVAKLLKRLGAGESTLLPFLHPKKHHWIIVAPNRRTLESVLSAIHSFLIPTYCEFAGSKSLPQLKYFDKDGNELHQIGSSLFKSGYYVIESPPKFLPQILEHLDLWLDIETRRPTALIKKKHTYRELYEQFNVSVADADWVKSEICLQEIQKLNLTTADNLNFLQIQLFAAQNNWRSIWGHPNFEILAKLKMPRLIRAALLSSVYYEVLEPIEQKGLWSEALQEFTQIRPRLGLLLTGRFGIIQDPVLKVFAYQAVVSKDKISFEELEHIRSESSTKRTLEELRKFLPSESLSTSSITPKKQILLALDDANYDAVLQILKQIPNGYDKVFLFLETAFFSGDLDGDLAREALSSYQELPEHLRQELHEIYPQILHYVNALELEVHSGFMRASWLNQTSLLRESTWRLICELETQLRHLIESRYIKQFGDDWDQRINHEWKEKWALAKQKDDRAFEKYGMAPQPILNYSYLGELVALINNEWGLFEDIFGHRKLNRPIFTQKLESIIKVRNPLAHNRPIPNSELKIAEKNSREILISLKNSTFTGPA